MVSMVGEHIDTIMAAYDAALKQILIKEENVEAAQQRLDDLDELRERLKNKRGQDGDIVSEAVAEIGGKRAARLAVLLDLQESQKADLVEKQGDRNLFFTLRFKSTQVLERLRNYAMDHVDARGIDWHDPEDYHVTLVFVPGLDLLETTELSILVNTANVTPVEVDGFGVFEQAEGAQKDTLFLQVRATEELRDLQRRLYELVVSKGHDTSPFSLPETWRPHITIATAEEPFDIETMPEVGAAVDGSQVVASVDFNIITASTEQVDEVGTPAPTSEEFTTPAEVLQDVPAPEMHKSVDEQFLKDVNLGDLLDTDNLYDIVERGYLANPGDLDDGVLDMLIDLITNDELNADSP